MKFKPGDLLTTYYLNEILLILDCYYDAFIYFSGYSYVDVWRDINLYGSPVVLETHSSLLTSILREAFLCE